MPGQLLAAVVAAVVAAVAGAPGAAVVAAPGAVVVVVAAERIHQLLADWDLLAALCALAANEGGEWAWKPSRHILPHAHNPRWC